MKLFESLLFFARLRPIIKDLLLSSLNVKIFVRKLSRNCLDINHDRLVLFIYLFIYSCEFIYLFDGSQDGAVYRKHISIRKPSAVINSAVRFSCSAFVFCMNRTIKSYENYAYIFDLMRCSLLIGAIVARCYKLVP